MTFNNSSNIPTIQPTFVPTFKISANPSSIPSTKPSVSTMNDPTLLPSFSPSFSCKSDEDRFIFKFNTGKRPWQTEVYIKEKTDPNKKLKWKSIIKLPFENFKPNDLFTFSTCLKKCTFYRFEIIDRKKNGIGSYEIFYGGEKLNLDPFEGSSQTIDFGSECTAPTIFCKKGYKSLYIEFKADKYSIKHKNQLIVEKLKNKNQWKKSGKKLSSLKPLKKIIDERCLDKNSCYRVKVTDSKGDGICCESGKGEYKLIYDGLEVKHDPFNSGKVQKVE